MDKMAEEMRLPIDVEAQPLVRAAAALRPMLRNYRDEIEREQRLPRDLVEQLRAAGFYRMVIPRALGGLQVDPLTYLRVVEMLAEGVGSVGWNLGNGGVGQLVTLGLPDEGVDELYGKRADTIIAGTAVPGGGQAVPVAGGYRVSGRWQFGSGCQEATWMLGSFQVIGDDGEPRRHPDGGSLYLARRFCALRSRDRAGKLGRGRAAGHRQLRLDGRRRVSARAADDAANRHSAREPVGAVAGRYLRLAGPVLGRAAPQCRHHRHRARRHRRADRARRRQAAARPARRMLCDNPQVQDAVGRADAILNAGRAYRSAMIAELWGTVAAGDETTLEQRARCRLAAIYAADSAREAMDLVYRHGGSTSFKRESRLAECWRDLHTVGQTVTIAPSGTRSAAGSTSGWTPARVCASHHGQEPLPA